MMIMMMALHKIFLNVCQTAANCKGKMNKICCIFSHFPFCKFGMFVFSVRCLCDQYG